MIGLTADLYTYSSIFPVRELEFLVVWSFYNEAIFMSPNGMSKNVGLLLLNDHTQYHTLLSDTFGIYTYMYIYIFDIF